MKETHGTPPALPAEARPAWQAYRAMCESKSSHYEFLEHIEIKYQYGGRPSLAERARLGTLLAAHDACVRAFADAVKSLSAANALAHAELVRLLAETRDLEDDTPRH